MIEWLLVPKLQEIRKRLPTVRFKFLNLSTAESVKRLSNGLIDFAVPFPLVARAVAKVNVAAILPSFAEIERPRSAVEQVKIPFLKGLDRKICLASNARLIRIRPILGKVASERERLCRF